MRIALSAAIAAAVLGGAAPAGELVIGLGGEFDRDDHAFDTPALSLDYQSEPVADLGSLELRVGVAGEANADHDLWAGVGPVATLPVGAGFRIEGSVMAGAFAHGDGRDLGGPLVFRSRIGLSAPVAANVRMGLAFEHKSNAGVHHDNPGVETLLVSVGVSY